MPDDASRSYWWPFASIARLPLPLRFCLWALHKLGRETRGGYIYTEPELRDG